MQFSCLCRPIRCFQLTRHVRHSWTSSCWGSKCRSLGHEYSNNPVLLPSWQNLELWKLAKFLPHQESSHQSSESSCTSRDRQQLQNILNVRLLLQKSMLIFHALLPEQWPSQSLCNVAVTVIVLGWGNSIPLFLGGIEASILEIGEYSVLGGVICKVFLGDLLHDLAKQQKPKIRVGEFGAHWVDRLEEGDVLHDIILGGWEGSRVIIGQASIMQQQVLDCCVAFLVCIIVLNILADQIVNVDGVAADQVHERQGGCHHFGD